MRKLTLSIGLIVLSSLWLYGQTFKVDTVAYNGNIHKRMNIVFLSDGYQQNELDQYVVDAKNIASQLFSQAPFSYYSRYFNVFAIRVPSNVSGAASDPASPIDNYFGSTFNYGGIDRLLVPVNTGRVSSVLASNFPSYDLAIMVVNSTKYGGSGGFVATASVNSASGEIAIHEIGHSFVGLKDEYWAGTQYAGEGPNMTKTSNNETIKWKSWLGKESVGIYPYEVDASWHRPHQSCKMRYLNYPFCAVCREAFIETFFRKNSPIDSYSPTSTSNLNQTQEFILHLIKPLPNTLHVQWKLNSTQTAKDTSKLTMASPLPQSGALLVRVIDTTTLYKKIKIYASFVKWTFTNSSIIAKDSAAVYEPETITSVDQMQEPGFQLTAYPNPAADRTTLTMPQVPSSEGSVSVFDAQGKRLELPQELTADGFHSVDFGKQPSGIYFIVLETPSGKFRTKLVKE